MNHLNDLILEGLSLEERRVSIDGERYEEEDGFSVLSDRFSRRETDSFVRPQLKKMQSAAGNLQPSVLKHLVETVRKVPNKSDMRNLSLCSLARVFNEVEKTNPDGEPFYVKDLVMIDARLRDWKRIMPHIRPSYEIRSSPDPQILKRLVQGGAVFTCDDEEELELLDSLGEDVLAKMSALPSEVSSHVMVYASTEEELQTIHTIKPLIRVILRLAQNQQNLGSPREELVKLLNSAKTHNIQVSGISLPAWNNFSETDINTSLCFIRSVYTLAEQMGFKFTVLDIDSELPSHNFEKCAKTFTKLMETHFPRSEGVELHLSASHHFSENSHFLFTRVVQKSFTAAQQDLYLDWPEKTISRLESTPHTCITAKTKAPRMQTNIYSFPSNRLICNVELSEVKIGEWLYWNNTTYSPRSRSNSSDSKHYHSFRFEGPEKKFEVNYKPIPGDDMGFRALDTEKWQEILNHGHLLILSEKKNEHFDSYLLSESSLFVYPYKVIVKTCGISSPLLCTQALRDAAVQLNTEIESITFSRRSFICPSGQCFPHRNIDEETKFLNKNFPGGKSLQLGDPKSDHWFLYSANFTSAPLDRTPYFEVTMTGLMSEEALQLFWRDENATDADNASVAQKSGFAAMTPGADIDEYSFTPCGFSYNGLKDNGFVTVHITPELPLCYISFETNIAGLSYEKMLQTLITKYQPAHFTVLIQNNGGKTIPLPGYSTTHSTETELNGVPVLFERRKLKKMH